MPRRQRRLRGGQDTDPVNVPDDHVDGDPFHYYDPVSEIIDNLFLVENRLIEANQEAEMYEQEAITLQQELNDTTAQYNVLNDQLLQIIQQADAIKASQGRNSDAYRAILAHGNALDEDMNVLSRKISETTNQIATVNGYREMLNETLLQTRQNYDEIRAFYDEYILDPGVRLRRTE